MALGHLSSGRAVIKPTSQALALLAIIIIMIYALTLSSTVAFAAQVTIAWDSNADPGLAGYKIYWGTVSRDYSWSADAGTHTTYTAPNLSEGATYYFSATAYDAAYTESKFSNEITYTVPSTCTYAISPNSQSFGAGGGTGSVSVSTGAGCNWSTSNNAQWISIASGASGSGKGTMAYSVAANTGSTSRAAGLTVAGGALTINQTGQSLYTISVSPGVNGTITPGPEVNLLNGANQTFTIAPVVGYKVADVVVDGSSVGARTSYTFTNVTSNHTISASFIGLAYALSVSTSGTGTGTVTNNPSGTTFGAGTSVTLTATPGANATFAGWSGTCSGTSSTCTVVMNSNLNVCATFNVGGHTITARAGSGGSITPSGTVTVSDKGSQMFIIIPAADYAIADVSVDNSSVGAVSTWTFSSVTSNHTIQASFAQQSGYKLNITKSGTGKGLVYSDYWSPTYKLGTAIELTAEPEYPSTFGGWSGACSGTSSTCKVVMNSNLSVTATFNLSAIGGHTITATAGSGGSITPSGTVTVSDKGSQTFTITPAALCKIADVLIDGASVGARTSYTFNNVTSNHTVQASFVQAQSDYALTIIKSGTGTGTVTSNPSGTTFGAGTSVTLTATPGANATFAGWSGTCSGTSSTCKVVLNSNLSVAATFNLSAIGGHTITATAGSGGSITPSGTVTVSDKGSQTFTITPAALCKIADVLIDGASVGARTSYTFNNVTSNHTVQASFVQAQSDYALTIIKSGTGTGTVTSNPSGTTFGAGTSVTLTATPGANATFAGWSGTCSGTSSTCKVVLNSNLSVAATFNLGAVGGHTITATAGSGGSITPSGTVTVSDKGSQMFIIIPAADYAIADVSVDNSSVGAVSTWTFSSVTSNHSIQASFTQQSGYKLTVTKSGTGKGLVYTDYWKPTYKRGETMELSAEPDERSTFAGWSGACSGRSTTCTVMINGNTVVNATFNLTGN